MLPARHRLRSAALFREASRRGVRSPGRRGPVALHLLARAVPEPALVGFVVPKAVGSAVTRNLVKRRLRHLATDRVGALDPGTVLVVRALPGSATASFAELADALDRCLVRVTGRGSSGGGAE